MKKEFCGKCGAECIIKKFISEYDTSTGEPIYGYKIQCPIYLTWSWKAWEHTSYKDNEAE